MPAKKRMPAKRKAKRGESPEDFFKRRTAEIEGLGLTRYLGKAIYIGYEVDTPRLVFFKLETTGYPSSWDEKSYELAKMSFLHDKRMWVVADGSPVGANIKEVILIGW